MTSPIKVVIADDHESVRAGIAAILGTDPGIEIVAQASDGFEAVLECVKHSPDVALVDLRMPQKDGIWATERITSQTQTRVLILTTYDSDDLIAQGLTNQKIAEHLGVGVTTVKTHVGALYVKTGVTSRIELSRFAQP